jgi:uncharacterized protein involved in exopolysaccharide biosynthesis
MPKNELGVDTPIARKLGLPGVGSIEASDPQHAPFRGYVRVPPRTDLGFREFWRSLARHKLLLLTAVITVTAIATVAIIRARSTYLASTVLVMGTESPIVMRAGEMLVQNEESDAATVTAIKTKMVMMKSHELLEDVVVNLELDQNRKFLEGLNQGPLARLLELGRDPQPLLAEPAKSAGAAVGAVDKDEVRSLEERTRLDPLVRSIENGLSVEQIKETRALKVSFIHTDPEIAAAIADGVAQSFIQRNFQNKTERFTNAASWLNQSTADLKRRVEKSEQALANYTRANNIFTIAGTSTLTTEKLAQLHDQVTRAEAARILKETLYEEVKSGRVAEVPEVFAEMTSKSAPRILELKKQLDELTTQEAQLSVHYGPSNPQVLEVRQQLATIKEQIEASRQALNNKLRA